MSKPESHRAVALQKSLLALLALLVQGCGLGMTPEERLARAEEALAAGESRAAIIDAKNVLLDSPDHADARVLLGRASLSVGDAPAAEKELRRAIELGVTRESVALDIARAMFLQGKHRQLTEEFDGAAIDDQRSLLGVLGSAYLALGEPDTARDRFQSVLESDPANADAKLGIVRSYVSEGNLLQARETLGNLLESDPGYAPARLLAGRLHMAAGDTDAASREFARAAELGAASGDDGTRAEAVYGLAEAALAQNDIAAAERHAATLADLTPNATATLEIAGRIAFARQDWPAAQEKFGEILRRAPGHRIARTLLGSVHLQSGNLGQAEMHLSEAVAANPGDAYARTLLAEARLKLNKSAEAEMTIAPLVSAENPDPRSLAMAARVDLLSGDFEGAASYLERSAADYPASSAVQLDLAVVYILSGRLEEASRILDRDPGDDSPDDAFRRELLRILAELRGGGQETALKAAATLRENHGDRAMAHILHGALLFSADDPVSAREAFIAARKVDPGDISALRYLARVEESTGDWEAAKEHYREILELQPGDAHALFSLGRIAARNEKVDEAIDFLERARAAESAGVAPRLLLARLYVERRRWDDAERAVLEVLEINEGIAGAHNLLGIVELGRQRPAEAEERFARAVELAPQDRDVRNNLVRAKTLNGKADEALSTQGVDSDVILEHLPSGVLRANAQLRAGRPEAALETVRILREKHPQSAIPIVLEAELLARSGAERAEVIRLYDEALDKELTRAFALRAYRFRRQANHDKPEQPLLRYLDERPLDSDARSLLAQHYQEVGQTADAVQEYRRILETSPDNYVALNNLAWLYMKMDDSRAEATARRAAAIAPDNGSVLDTLGWILVNGDKVSEGVELLREAVRKDGTPEVRYHLAAALAKSGNDGEARRLLEDILSSNSEFPSRNDARTLLASL